MTDDRSIDPSIDLDRRIAWRVRELRAAHGFTLDQLATRSGVSRSMISVVERGESSPTAALLDKLAGGLGVSLCSLFDEPDAGGISPLARREAQPQWRDPASGYVRRNLSPPGFESPIQMVEVSFPPGGHVTYDNSFRADVQQQVWVVEGSIEVSVGAERHRLAEGDCLAMRLNAPTAYSNPTKKRARYIVVLTQPTSRHGRAAP